MGDGHLLGGNHGIIGCITMGSRNSDMKAVYKSTQYQYFWWGYLVQPTHVILYEDDLLRGPSKCLGYVYNLADLVDGIFQCLALVGQLN